jgi:hypothetical protein
MKTIYAVSSGEYSDYSVRGVFEDEATAKAWADAMNSGESRYEQYRVESFTFIPAGTAPFKVTEYQKTAQLNDDGTVTAEREWDTTHWAISSYYGIPPVRPAVRYVRAPCHKGTAGRIDIRGSDQQAVRQAMSDKIAAWKSGVWAGPNFVEINEGGDEPVVSG